MKLCAVAFVFLAGPALAQSVGYSDARTMQCLSFAGEEYGADACIGESANLCMESADGGTTYGMMGCLDGELQFWDRKLNANYRVAMANAKQSDIDTEAKKYGRPSQAEALRDMQRAWITFRDASCAYEHSRWGGGTGAGPAAAACMMRLTGTQALVLAQ